jgi:Fe-S oxidoreductase
VSFDLYTEAGIAAWKAFLTEAADLVVSMGGSLSGEHGDGQARGWLLGRMFGDELLDAFREFKRIWDPDGRMNPGKLIDADPVDAHLRVGPGFALEKPKTAMVFAEDQRSFPRAAMRCVGVGLCRREEGATMCPSWRATHEEAHTTRGRARLLQEMLRGETPSLRSDAPVQSGFRSDEVRDSLSLCLSCKGCLSDCPMGVDMASYKAEFLAHHYAGRIRPRPAYAFGFIDKWARMAAIAPGLVNALGASSWGGGILRALGGIAPERPLPRFADTTFRAWATRRRAIAGPRVVLWADTFTNHFHPEIGEAAIDVLEAAGFSPEVPRQALCCGRPLYDFGWLGAARRYLDRVLRAMRPALDDGLPIVVLEPSCLSTFRHELLQIFPDRADARAFAKAVTSLGEVLRGRAAPWRVDGKLVVHGHCHQKALWGTTADVEVLTQAGAQVEPLATGCCGMAGGFGFEADKYEVSRRVYEGDLGPALDRSGDARLVTDGFSCRTQVQHLGVRRAWHLAEVLAEGLEREAAPVVPERVKEPVG